MKRPTFVKALKQTGVVAAISLGMLFITTHHSSALTDDTATQTESVETPEDALSASETSAVEDNINIEEVPCVKAPEDTGTDSANADTIPDSPDSDDTVSSDLDPSVSDSPSAELSVTDFLDVNLSVTDSPDADSSDSEPSDMDSDDSFTSVDPDRSADTDATSDIPSSVNPSSQESVTVNPNLHIQDESSDAVYTQPFYSRSELFWNMKDKITYNVALPIDNIPSFITQEMIIGALKCQDETGYPASVTIAQIIQESGYGNYGPGGEEHQGLSYLAYQYCNLFGIKGTGTAGSVEMYTFEQALSGEYYKTTSGFRVYNTYTECIEDRTEILKDYYNDLTKNVTDANTFAMKIGSRWATSQTYGQNLITQMEQYDLYRLDRLTLTDFSEMIGKFADPCPGSYQTSDFGYRTFDNKFHKGIDLGTNGYELPTYAAEAGTVITAGWDDTAGNWIVIDHGNGLVTKYMHHSKIFVEEGQHIEKGQQIGLTGNTGRSSGIHLHFQVEENGVAVDPSTYLNQPPEE